MLGLILLGAAAAGAGGLFSGGVRLGCRPVDSYCWRDDPSGGADDCPCRRGAQDPVSAAVAYLNKPFIIDRYRGRKVYPEDTVCRGDTAWVMLRFGDGDRMGFELCRSGCVWKVCRYCYADL